MIGIFTELRDHVYAVFCICRVVYYTTQKLFPTTFPDWDFSESRDQICKVFFPSIYQNSFVTLLCLVRREGRWSAKVYRKCYSFRLDHENSCIVIIKKLGYIIFS